MNLSQPGMYRSTDDGARKISDGPTHDGYTLAKCVLCRWKDKENSTCSAFLQPEYVLVDTSNIPVPRAPAPQTGGSADGGNHDDGASATEAQ